MMSFFQFFKRLMLILAALLVCTSVFSLPLPETQDKANALYHAYEDSSLKYIIKGPKDWFLYVQNEFGTGMSDIIPDSNSNLRALFSSYNLKNRGSWPIKS